MNVFGKSQGNDVQTGGRTVEHAEHDGLAELRGQGRNTQVHLAARHVVIDAAILR